MPLSNLLLLFYLLACSNPMETERVLVLDSETGHPVAGVHVYKEPVRSSSEFFNPWSRLRPLPPASEGVSDANGLLTLQVPRGHRAFMVGVKSEEYELDRMAAKVPARPEGVDVIYQVRRRQ